MKGKKVTSFAYHFLSYVCLLPTWNGIPSDDILCHHHLDEFKQKMRYRAKNGKKEKKINRNAELVT